MIRNSNLEILRIISMLFIIMGHIGGQASFIELSVGFNHLLVLLLTSGARIAVNVFLIISCWFLVDKKFSSNNIILIYLELVFYTVGITTIVIICGENASTKDILRGYFPFFGRALWFVSAYITLCLMCPFLNKILKWRQKELRLFCILSFVFISFISTLPTPQLGYVSDLLWFWFVYIWIGYYKKYIYLRRLNIFLNDNMGVFMGIIFYICLVLFRFYAEKYHINFLIAITLQYLGDIKTIPNILCAFLFFSFFNNMKEKYIKPINSLAKNTLAVYIIHQVPAFYNILWNNILYCNNFNMKNNSYSYIILIAIVVYVCASLIDCIRIWVFNILLLENKYIRIIEKKIEGFYCS